MISNEISLQQPSEQLRSFKGALSGLRHFLANESPLKMMKNAFLFHLKSFFRSQDVYVFALTFWSCSKEPWLKDKVNFKFYDVKAWLANNCNISRSKDKQIMGFGQIIECNVGNIFLEKSYAKCGEETNPKPVSEKLKLNISLDQ